MVDFFEIQGVLRHPRTGSVRFTDGLDRAASTAGVAQGQQAPMAESKQFLPGISRVELHIHPAHAHTHLRRHLQ